MQQAVAARTPAHVWIVGILSLLWNGFGCYDYLMTRTKGAAYIDSMMHTDQGSAILAYINAFPIWVSAAWGFGVWGGIAGSILLLMRSRHAVTAFAVSMIGAIVGLIGILFEWKTPQAWDWLYLFLVGVFSQLGQVFLTNALQREKVAGVAIVNYTGLIYALIIGSVVFGEEQSTLSMSGMLLVVFGVLLSVLYGRRLKEIDKIEATAA